MVEGALFGIAQEKGHIADGEFPLYQKIKGSLLAHVRETVAIGGAFFLEFLLKVTPA